MKHRFSLYSLFLLLPLALMGLFTNCSPTFTAQDNQSANGVPYQLDLISTAPYSIDSNTYTIQNYKFVASTTPIYFQFISACSTKCPVVVVSMPYTGINWSGDSLDLSWALRDPTGMGGLFADVNGPNYVASSNDVIAYYHSSLSDAVGPGAVFLNSGVSVVVVYSRFYLGRSADEYVSDFSQVLNQLSELPTVDTSKVALLGNSLGGFISLHGSRKSAIQPVAIVGITPLLDLADQYNFMSTVSQRITANPSMLSATQNFFDSYIRRFETVDRNRFTSVLLASENSNSKILVIHDTWDTIVPISQWQQFSAVREIDSFIYQHATGIDYNTFTSDHSQSSEGYTNKSVMPIYMSYILTRLKAPSEPKVIYYYYNDFASALVQAKAAKDRGQNISWIKNLFTDLCTNNLTMKDLSNTLGTTSGAHFVGGVLVNIWGFPTTTTQGCQYLESNPNLFN